MAMEKQFTITDTHSKSITAIGFHTLRREFIIGFEDGVMKWWEQDNGKLMLTTHEHRGWLTAFVYWPEQKILLSSANDGYIIAWGSGGNVVDKIMMGFPVYSMCLNIRRQHIVCGFNSSTQIFSLDIRKTHGHVIDKRKPFIAKDHTDIVSAVICHESKVFTAGYDTKMCIYDATLYPGQKGLKLTHCNSHAHQAGINCMILVKDNEANTWLLTGSFDRSVKVWSQDGQLLHRLETIFLNTISSLCYVPRAKTVWVASSSAHATLYDPKAGENVSDFLPTFESESDSQQRLVKLRYNPESSQIIGTTHRRLVIVWKFNTSGCMTALKSQTPIECITYTRKVPMLLFSGAHDGSIQKWERLQASHFMYSTETLPLKEALDKLRDIEKMRGINKKKILPIIQNLRVQHSPSSHYANYNTGLVKDSSKYQSTNNAILRATFVEHLDLLVTASEDGNIYLWGFDNNAVNALTSLHQPKPVTQFDRKYSVLIQEKIDVQKLSENTIYEDGDESDDEGSDALAKGEPAVNVGNSHETKSEEDSVTNRVAGFICKNVLIGHDACVTSLAVVTSDTPPHHTYLISGGWDRRILIWDLNRSCLHSTFRVKKNFYTATKEIINQKRHTGDEEWADGNEPGADEIACDGIIIDMDYCKERNEFAYASSDGMVYIRDFNPNGVHMQLRNVLQGHDLEITSVKWNAVYSNWITSSEDATIRIWSSDGMKCERMLTVGGAVSALCVDEYNGCIIAGVEKNMKVFDMETLNLVQTNVGHTDIIRSIVHVKERSQYASVSWDKTLRIWNAYRRPCRRKKNVTIDENV